MQFISAANTNIKLFFYVTHRMIGIGYVFDIWPDERTRYYGFLTTFTNRFFLEQLSSDFGLCATPCDYTSVILLNFDITA